MSLHPNSVGQTVVGRAGFLRLSTDIGRQIVIRARTDSMRFRNDQAEPRELPYCTDAWHSECFIPHRGQPVDWDGERKESVSIPARRAVNPNQKDSQIRVARTLSNVANTPRMSRIRTAERQSSVCAKFMVMDRAAECAAGGKDAV